MSNRGSGESGQPYDPRDPRVSMPDYHEELMRRFLQSFNVKRAIQASRHDIHTLWRHLSRNPSQINDFTYVLTERRARLERYPFPLAVSMRDLIEHSHNISPDESPRIWLVREAVVPTLTALGYDGDDVSEEALGRLDASNLRGEYDS
jgi:hypothetical protein